MTVRDLCRWVLAAGLVLGLSLSFTQTTHAAPATFNVDTTADNATLTACTAAPNDCSLRGAIIAANTNGNPGNIDIINVPSGTYTFAIPSTNEDAALDGDLDITQSVNIIGAGAEVTIIQAAAEPGVADDRVFSIWWESTVVGISNVMIRHGIGISDPELYEPVGGGILNFEANLVINNSIIANNSASDGGGGITNAFGTLVINNSTITGNFAAYSGGGIFNYLGLMTVNNSTVSSSINAGIRNDGDMFINSSTISGNTGDGIENWGVLAVNNSTISENQGGIYNGDTATLKNTMVASATGDNCLATADIISNGYNLSSDASCTAFFDGPGDLNNVDPMLGPLRNNGGPTLTHALLPGSPAINGGDPDFVPPPDFDQRGIGFPRVQDGRIDIGAYEAWLLEKPSGIVTDSLGNVIYRWPDQPGATSYNLYVYRGANVNNAVVNRQNIVPDCDGSVCTLDIVSAFGHAYWLNNGDYTVWLRANPGGAWTQAGTFTIQTPLAAAVTIQPPSDTHTRRPSLHWTLEGEAVWASWFRLYIAPSNKLGTPVLDQWVMRGDVCGDMNGAVCSFPLPLDLARNGMYQFWAQGWGPGGMSAWIGSGNFQIGPLVPEGLLVEDVTAGVPDLSWTASEGVTWYQVWIGTLGPAVAAHNQWYDATADLECGGGTCMLTPAVTLADGSYKWYVRGWGDGGYTLGGAGGWAQGPDIEVPIP